MRRAFRCASLSLLIVLTMAICSTGAAAEAKMSFRIPAQSAYGGLAEFGRQSGHELLFAYEDVQGRRTQQVEGSFEPSKAIELLLAESGLHAVLAANGVFVIQTEPRGRTPGAESHTNSLPGAKREDQTRSGTSPEALSSTRARSIGPESSRASAAGEELERVIVTGSRIPQDGFATPMPLVGIDRATLESSGYDNLADILMQMPAIGVGAGLATSRQSVSFGAGRSLLNLRRLGVDRTLVLVNGRRQVAGAPLSAAVDLNTIPAPLVERTEIVTGGTSAVYGADAVSGAINVVLRQNFSGLEVRGRSGITSRGDGLTRGISVIAGSNFIHHGREGNATLSFVYDDTDGVDAVARDWATNGLDTISNPNDHAANDGTPNFVHARDIRFNGFSDAGHFVLRGQTWIFTQDGLSMRPFDFGAIGDRFGRSVGGDGGFFERFDPLTLPIARRVLAGTLRYPLASDLDLFFEGRASNTQVQQAWQPTLDPLGAGEIRLSIDNPFLPPATVALMRGDPADPADDVDSINVHRIFNELGRRGTDNDRQMRQYVAGLKGHLGRSWAFELSYANGRTTDTTLQLNDRDTARYEQSLDAVRDPATGQIVCRDPANGCVPLDVVGPNHASPDAVAFSRIQNVFFQEAVQEVTDANITGTLFELPAGPLQISAGAEHRRERALSQPSAVQALGESFLPQVDRTAGRFGVLEGYIEMRAPLLRNRPWAQDLSMSVAARESDYTTSGRKAAWNAGLEFEPVRDLRIRTMLSHAVRAPNLGELFSPVDTDFFFGQDPCDVSVRDLSINRRSNCLSLGIPDGYAAPTNGTTLKALLGGNPALVPETAETFTAGVILLPRFVPGLSFVADYWRMEIHDAVDAIPAQTIADNCVDLPIPVALNPNCALVARDPSTLEIRSIRATQLNIGKIVTSGVDAQLGYRMDAAALSQHLIGVLDFNVIASYLDALDFFTDAGDPRSRDPEAGVLGNPRVRFTSSLTYQGRALNLTWRAQYVGNSKIVSFRNLPPDQFDLPDTGTRMFHDLSVGYALNAHAAVRLNIQNIFDTRPPQRGFLIHSGIGTAAIYPNLGLTVYGTVTYKL
jgi:outer membrane receptor protein involved in Fe transport